MIKYASIELSSACQIQCDMCARERMTRKNGLMSKATIDKAFAELSKQEHLEFVVLNCWGEPTMNKNLKYAIEMTKTLQARSVMSTNCVQYIDGLPSMGLDELILNIGEVSGKRADNAVRYIEHEFTGNLMYIQYIVAPETQDGIEAFVKKFEKYTDDNRKLFLKYPVCDDFKRSPVIRDDVYNFKADNILVAGKPLEYRGETCKLGDTIVILSDGRVTLGCCDPNDSMLIGHIDDGLDAVMNGETCRHLIEAFPDNGVCGECIKQAGRA